LLKDRPGGVNIGLIDQVIRFSLESGYHVVLDGIFYADRYEPMLAGLARDHLGVTRFYYLDVPMEETLRRHTTRPQAAEFGPGDMRGWYRPRDFLDGICERIIPETTTLTQTIALILAETQHCGRISGQRGPHGCRISEQPGDLAIATDPHVLLVMQKYVMLPALAADGSAGSSSGRG
jgi:hypothetical protein